MLLPLSNAAQTRNAAPYGTSLDQLSRQASAVYSIRRINQNYTGPLVRVRRSSDNAEADIGYITSTPQSRTNLFPNPGLSGAVVGTSTLPTNLGIVSSTFGLTLTVTGTGVEAGQDYVEINLAGTCNAAGTYRLATSNATLMPISPSTNYTVSWATRSIAGTQKTASIGLIYRRADTSTSTNFFVSTAPSIIIARTQNTATSPADGAFVNLEYRITFALSEVVNFTLRLYSPQVLQSTTTLVPLNVGTVPQVFGVENDLDMEALATHVGTGSGFVVTWYDQSGNGRHATQITTSAQPRIFNAGCLEVSMGHACIRAHTNATFLPLHQFAIPNTSFSAIFVAAKGIQGTLNDILGSDGAGFNFNGLYIRMSDSFISHTFQLPTSVAVITSSISPRVLVAQQLHCFGLYVNNSVNFGTVSVDATTRQRPVPMLTTSPFVLGTNGAFRIGEYLVSQPTLNFLGVYSEVFMFPFLLQSSDIEYIERQVGQYYSVVPV